MCAPGRREVGMAPVLGLGNENSIGIRIPLGLRMITL